MDLKEKMRIVPDFPKEGISYKDIVTILQDKDAFHEMIKQLCELIADLDYDYILGVESRGFIVGAPVAYEKGKGFLIARKPGKLPGRLLKESYDLEYGSTSIEIDADSVPKGAKVVIMDDLLATGGTVNAAAKLLERAGAEVVGMAFLTELTGLSGREKNSEYDVRSILKWEF